MAQKPTSYTIGPKTKAWLESIGIYTVADLQATGVVETYLKLKAAFPNQVTLNALWGLEGVANNRHWQDIPEERKAELRQAIAKKEE